MMCSTNVRPPPSASECNAMHSWASSNFATFFPH